MTSRPSLSSTGDVGEGEETKGACLSAPGSRPSDQIASRSGGKAASIPSRDPMPIARHIIYFGLPGVVACDARCDKAWGINSRPEIILSEDPDDTAFLADGELGDAPVDPGTYEGGHAKPTCSGERLNKWCVRECERSVTSSSGNSSEVVEVRDFSRRVYNMPWLHKDEPAPVDEPPQGGDPHGAPGRSPASAVGEAEASNSIPTPTAAGAAIQTLGTDQTGGSL